MSKPKLRPAKSRELAHNVGDALLDFVVNAREVFPSCLNCFYFAEAQQWCTLYGGHPPPRVIVYSCGVGYVDCEAIPF